jgi:hypothetical protein
VERDATLSHAFLKNPCDFSRQESAFAIALEIAHFIVGINQLRQLQLLGPLLFHNRAVFGSKLALEGVEGCRIKALDSQRSQNAQKTDYGYLRRKILFWGRELRSNFYNLARKAPACSKLILWSRAEIRDTMCLLVAPRISPLISFCFCS